MYLFFENNIYNELKLWVAYFNRHYIWQHLVGLSSSASF